MVVLNIVGGVFVTLWSWPLLLICYMGCNSFIDWIVFPELFGVFIVGLGALFYAKILTRKVGVVIWLLYALLLFVLHLIVALSAGWLGLTGQDLHDGGYGTAVFFLGLSMAPLTYLVLNLIAFKEYFAQRR